MDSSTLEALQQLLSPDRVSTAASERAIHSADMSAHVPSLPDAIAWPETTEEVSAILRLAAEHRLPVTGWGAGSSLEGNPIPVRGGLVVDFGRMNRIVAIHDADFQITVQPGIHYKDMNKVLERYGLFFAPDPGANASIGGMIANNAAGTRTVKYGATRDNVLALEVVLAGGEIIRTGSRAVKQSAGYDLTHLIIGSEGTLGLVTEATLRLAPLPEHFSAALATFATTAAAAQAVYQIIGSGVGPAALELLDPVAIEYMNRDDEIDLPVAPTLLMEFHGPTVESLNVELDLVRAICAETGATHVEMVVGREDRNRLWRGRHQLGEILIRAHPGTRHVIADVAVPISHYPELAAYGAELMAAMDIRGTLFGHAGDGNMHTHTVAPEGDAEGLAQLHVYNDRLVMKAIELGGTCTGEHGVGIGKQKYLAAEHGEAAVAVMRRLKATLDPHGILNPGKVLGEVQTSEVFGNL